MQLNETCNGYTGNKIQSYKTCFDEPHHDQKAAIHGNLTKCLHQEMMNHFILIPSDKYMKIAIFIISIPMNSDGTFRSDSREERFLLFTLLQSRRRQQATESAHKWKGQQRMSVICLMLMQSTYTQRKCLHRRFCWISPKDKRRYPAMQLWQYWKNSSVTSFESQVTIKKKHHKHYKGILRDHRE